MEEAIMLQQELDLKNAKFAIGLNKTLPGLQNSK